MPRIYEVKNAVGITLAAELGKPKLAFNFDGGSSEKLTLGATGGYRMQIDISGLASHAGGAPEAGVSAIAIAALAFDAGQADSITEKIYAVMQSATQAEIIAWETEFR